jgi:hypothetical protein
VEPSRPLRIGDQERGEVIELLRRHAADGRLEPDELEARVDAAFAARTQADLVPLTSDLPPLPSTAARPRSGPPAHVRAELLKWAIVNAAVLAVWLATGDGLDDFWPKWVLIVSTVVLALRLVRRDPGTADVPADRPPDGPALPR